MTHYSPKSLSLQKSSVAAVPSSFSNLLARAASLSHSLLLICHLSLLLRKLLVFVFTNPSPSNDSPVGRTVFPPCLNLPSNSHSHAHVRSRLLSWDVPRLQQLASNPHSIIRQLILAVISLPSVALRRLQLICCWTRNRRRPASCNLLRIPAINPPLNSPTVCGEHSEHNLKLKTSIGLPHLPNPGFLCHPQRETLERMSLRTVPNSTGVPELEIARVQGPPILIWTLTKPKMACKTQLLP